jgi:hypothetical protein
MGRAACEACSATWSLGTNSAFALGSRKTTENLDRVGRSQELLDASSPALNTRTLTVDPVWLLLYLEKSLHICIYRFFFSCSYFGWASNSCVSHLQRKWMPIRTHMRTYIHIFICDYLSIGEFLIHTYIDFYKCRLILIPSILSNIIYKNSVRTSQETLSP